MPAVTPPPVITLPSRTTRAGSRDRPEAGSSSRHAQWQARACRATTRPRRAPATGADRGDDTRPGGEPAQFAEEDLVANGVVGDAVTPRHTYQIASRISGEPAQAGKGDPLRFDRAARRAGQITSAPGSEENTWCGPVKSSCVTPGQGEDDNRMLNAHGSGLLQR